MPLNLKTATSLIVGLALAANARAASITYTAEWDNYVPVPGVPLFDPEPGTSLYEVDISVQGHTTWTMLVQPGVSSGTYEATASAMLTNGVDLGSSTHDMAFSFGQPEATPDLSNDWSFSRQFTTDLSGFTGQGMCYPVGLESCEFLTTDTPLRSSVNTAVFGLDSYTVTYLFTVPEPPSVVLGCCAALAGIGWWASRFRKGKHA